MQLLFTHPSRASRSPSEGAAHEPPREPPRRWEDTDVLSKGQLIEQILLNNPSATLEFLSGFSASELSRYLNHLLWLQQPRTGAARWERPGETPAVVSRVHEF